MSTTTAQYPAIGPDGTAIELPRQLRGLAVFLDVDGSLVDIAEAPEAVIVPPGLPADLERASDCASGALALVSGRAIESLDRLFAPAKLTAIGLHGSEVREPDGALTLVPPPPILTSLRPPLASLVARFPGAQLEDKGRSLAVHFRRAPEAEADIEEAVEALAAPALNEIVIQKGKKVIELRPAGSSKGTAVEAMMRIAPFLGRKPLAIGDDVTDEAMFAAVNAMGGMSVRVGPPDRPTEAQFHVPDPKAVRAWIASVTN